MSARVTSGGFNYLRTFRTSFKVKPIVSTAICVTGLLSACTFPSFLMSCYVEAATSTTAVNMHPFLSNVGIRLNPDGNGNYEITFMTSPKIVDNISSTDREDIKNQVEEREKLDQKYPINGTMGDNYGDCFVGSTAIFMYKQCVDLYRNERIALAIYEDLSKIESFRGCWMHVCVKMDNHQNLNDYQNLNAITVNLYASEQDLLRNTSYEDLDIYGFYNCVGYEYVINALSAIDGDRPCIEYV